MQKPHSITIVDREKGNLSGVKAVLSYGADELCIDTHQGKLTVIGEGLKIEKFDESEGTLCFSGKVDGVKYATAKAPLIKRIFK